MRKRKGGKRYFKGGTEAEHDKAILDSKEAVHRSKAINEKIRRLGLESS